MSLHVMIGPGRRITLAELQAVAKGQGLLEWQQQGCDDNSDVSSLTDALSTVSLRDKNDKGINDTEILSVPETIAVLTVTALHLAQTKGLSAGSSKEALLTAERLVRTIRTLQQQQQSDSTLYLATADCGATVLQSVVALTIMSPATMARCCRLAVQGLAVATAVDLAAAALPIACVTVDSRGWAATAMAAVGEVQFDVGRPHRPMVTAAATCRAIWNASRFISTDTDVTDVTDTDANVTDTATAFTDLPQYHGPAAAEIKSAAAKLELEVNCVPYFVAAEATATATATATTAKADSNVWDETVAHLAAEQAVEAVSVLLTNSRARACINTTNTITNTITLPRLVQDLQTALQQEAVQACAKVKEEIIKAAQEASAKEAEKQARVDAAAADHNAAGSGGGEDEFAGMTDAQKNKILKKRAEKEAKAEAKRKAKEEKGVSLFGTGTQPLCQVLDESEGRLTPLCLTQMAALVEKLLSGGVQRKPKIAKGTRDYLPEQMMIRQQAFSIIRRVFQSHGAVEIDTPVFELKDTLTGKYGEDSKLIYDLADQGGELLALRYDLTVPFARFLSLNSVGNIKRFHIGKVYRRDQPALARGRYREFYQCDFDIAGVYGRMIPDSECLCVACEILDSLPIGDFGIKLNHRCLLDAILDLCGVPADKFRTICSAVDKLDKEPWSEVKREMVEEKGLLEEVAEKIGEFVLNKGAPWDMYKQLMDSKKFGKHKGAHEAMEDLRILFEYLEAMGKLKFISFDLSLARGLDYYTGVIYEAVCMNGNTQVGSIGGGGRYDHLVSMFQEAGKETPCVGVSVGIERVFTLMEERLREQQGGSIKQPNVEILIASAGDGMMKEKMKIAQILWDGKLSAEFSQQENAKLKNELRNALDRQIPFMVIVGEEELVDNKCNVKDLKAKTEEKVPIPELVSFLRKKGAIPVGCEFAMELLKEEEASS
jgi:histidyl-tRNA synthetase